MMARGSIFVLCLLVFAASGGFVTAHAQQSGEVSAELNKLETNGGSCRAYLVLTNGTSADFASLKMDLVLFDAEGVVVRRVALETAPLGAGKTSLKVFDIDGLNCDGIGRLLLNDILACDTQGSTIDCLDSIRPAARGPVPFIK